MVHDISIHASRGGSDKEITGTDYESDYFNPRFPRGKRQSGLPMPVLAQIFQSTLPAREATHLSTLPAARSRFQSTLPAGEATLGGSPAGIPCDFNPRFPRRKQRHDNDIDDNFTAISIHASHGGSDENVGKETG